MTKTIVTPLAERFAAKVRSGGGPNGDCIEWTAGTNKHGYGRITSGRREGGTLLAHRAAWLIAYGELPTGVLRHTCDNPPCVNVEHLIDGTQAENVQDSIDRGRASVPPTFFGVETNLAVLTEADVRDIKDRLARGGETHRAIAASYGVARDTVTKINVGKTWKHI